MSDAATVLGNDNVYVNLLLDERVAAVARGACDDGESHVFVCPPEAADANLLLPSTTSDGSFRFHRALIDGRN